MAWRKADGGRMDDDGVSRVCHFLNGFPLPKKRKAADENHVFQSKETGTYFFCFKDIACLFAIENLFSERIIPKGTM